MSHNTNGFSDIAATALCKIIRLKSMIIRGGMCHSGMKAARHKQKTLRQKGET